MEKQVEDNSNNMNGDKIKVVCISDTHTKHSKIKLPSGDILIHAGDFTFKGRKKEIIDFNKFLAKQDFKHKIVIAGNHELTFDSENYDSLMNLFGLDAEVSPKEAKALLTNCTYLENSGTEVLGYKFWGSPMTPEFFDWAFMKQRGDEIDQYWAMIPEDTDILITHGPPMGILDKVVAGDNVGCERLLDHVMKRVKPLYHIYGHIHESNGRQSLEVEGGRVVNFINAATCNYAYKPENEIYTFYLDKRQ
jgi:Icc-related predicted phosphoesterase